ncbi:MAG: hypothetical protein M3Z31_12175 [Pseudomonadota bacterium]|nr:hypothetical protein [Pseudomonadota bacterium]
MRDFKFLTLVLATILLGGCTVIQATKLWLPETFGLTQVTPSIHVEAGMELEAQASLGEAMVKAEAAIRSAYGGVVSHPTVNACASEACYESFGGGGSVAKIYGNRILLSPRGLTWNFLAHEWSHAEIRNRLTLGAWWRMPQWLDEGIAVAVSEAPEHSESHWQSLVASNIPRPGTDELRTYKTLRQWLAAVHKYGDDTNAERRAKQQPEIRPVYAAAGHEVRPWLAAAGARGLLTFIAHMNAGEDFESAYQSATSSRP